MGLFGGPKADKIMANFKNGKISLDEFAEKMADIDVFSTSPVGEDKNGNKQLYLLPGKDGVMCQPVFTSEEKGKKFFDSMGRANYTFLKGPVIIVIRTMRRMNENHANKAFGLIVNPLEEDICIPTEVIEKLK